VFCYTIPMSYLIVGLGNPGREYENTRHNAGQMMLDAIAERFKFKDAKESAKAKGTERSGEIAGKKVILLAPGEFMNNSGRSVKPYIKTPKDLERLVVIYDELDLPFGRIKLSYGRSAGGHNGLDSVIKALKSKDFLRIRVGITPATPGGKLKKPQGEQEVVDFILGKFSKKENEALEKVGKTVGNAVEAFIEEGREAATGRFNQ